MDLGVFYEVIVPLMEVEGTATICISTPLDGFNFYSELTELKDANGRLIFNVKHIKGDVPVPWKSAEGRSRVQAIYGAGRDSTYQREIMGEIVGDNNNCAFRADKLKRWLEKPPLSGPYETDDETIYIAIDPNGGATGSDGPGSDTAIVSFIVSGGRVVIVGLDSEPTKTPEQPRYMLFAHVDALMRQQCFARYKLMLIPEANCGEQAQELSRVMLLRSAMGWCDTDILCQKDDCYGIFTFPGDPERYVMRMREHMAQDGFFFHDNFVCANPYSNLPPATKRAETLQTFRRQLSSFRAAYTVPSSLTGRVRLVYSGKGGKDNKRTNRAKDDLVMALLFGYYYYTQHMSPYPIITLRSHRNMFQVDGGRAINKLKRLW